MSTEVQNTTSSQHDAKTAVSGCRILYLSLKKQPFDVMVTGEKNKEFRSQSEWILSRLRGKMYDYVKFVNGYGNDKPYFICEYKGWKINDTNFRGIYSNGFEVMVDVGAIIIQLGKIVERGNLNGCH